jgi:hypothetical protein
MLKVGKNALPGVSGARRSMVAGDIPLLREACEAKFDFPR